MAQQFDFLTEGDARQKWHSLLDELGLDELVRRCSVKTIHTDSGEFIRITVSQ